LFSGGEQDAIQIAVFQDVVVDQDDLPYPSRTSCSSTGLPVPDAPMMATFSRWSWRVVPSPKA